MKLVNAMIVLLVAVIVGAVLVGESLRSTQASIERNQHVGCLGTTFRTAQQVRIDWAIYTADRASAAVGGISLTQRQIRGREADALYVGMLAIVTVRFDVRDISLLPKALAVVARRTAFHCS